MQECEKEASIMKVLIFELILIVILIPLNIILKNMYRNGKGKPEKN